MYTFRYAVYYWFKLLFIDKSLYEDYEGIIYLEAATTQDVLYSYLNCPYIYDISLLPALELWYRLISGCGGLPKIDRHRFFKRLEPETKLINFRM